MKYPLLALCGLVSLPQILSAQDRPNVVIILADDMGFGDVSFNNPQSRVNTPNIDRLACDGVSFSDAHSGGAVSTPSRYGLVTGQYFFRAQKHQDDYPSGYLRPLIQPQQETIATLMKRAGYQTACVGKWHLGMEWSKKDGSIPLIPNGDGARTNIDYAKGVNSGPRSAGFDYSYVMPASLDMPPYLFVEDDRIVDTDIVLTSDLYPNVKEDTQFAWDRMHTTDKDIYWQRGVWWRNGDMSSSYRVEECMDVIADKGIEFIERSSKSEAPFMLYLPLTGPHTPWMPNDRFKGSTELGAYGDFIAQIDDIVLRVGEKLEELGIADNTIVIFSSDNGAAWREDDIQQYVHQANWGRRGQKGDAWDGGHHVPLIVSWPSGLKQKGEYRGVVSLVDILATLSDIAGVSINSGGAEDSFSFASVIEGDLESATRESIVYISSTGVLAVKEGDWKYIDGIGSCGFTVPSRLPVVEGGATGQLYNLADDPLESVNLSLEERERAEQLSQKLERIKVEGSRAN